MMDWLDWLRHRGGNAKERDDMQVRRVQVSPVEGGLRKTIPTLSRRDSSLASKVGKWLRARITDTAIPFCHGAVYWTNSARSAQREATNPLTLSHAWHYTCAIRS
jgi:hypothetical protein